MIELLKTERERHREKFRHPMKTERVSRWESHAVRIRISLYTDASTSLVTTLKTLVRNESPDVYEPLM